MDSSPECEYLADFFAPFNPKAEAEKTNKLTIKIATGSRPKRERSPLYEDEKITKKPNLGTKYAEHHIQNEEQQIFEVKYYF